MTAWLTLLGINEDGVDGLSPTARRLLAEASLVIGGARHLALADPLITGQRRAWPRPITEAPALLAAHRTESVVALASGDPFCFGVGPLLTRDLEAQEWRCQPMPSCLSLACARLGWALQEVDVISFCGRPLAALAALLQPGRRVLALSADASTPAEVAGLLRARGFGSSRITLMEALGGPQERVRNTTAADFDLAAHPLNLLAITLTSEPGVAIHAAAPGLDDAAFAHDGQLTKSEIRAATLAGLAPHPGALLWDIGAGSGAVGIEWMRQHPANRAIAIDRRADRLERARANAKALGVPGLVCVAGAAPAALAGLPRPDAVFIGGGATAPGLVEAVWAALAPGGRLVANAVTIETETLLFAESARLGGSLARLDVARLDTIGSFRGFRPAMTVTQWKVTKPC